MTLSLRVLGAAKTVTGSAHLLEAPEGMLLVDCGLFQGLPDAAERNARLPFDRASELAAVVLTHGHLDHVGRLPLLVKAGFTGKVLGHPATLALAGIVLRDAAKVAAHEGRDGYDAADVDATTDLFMPLEYRKRTALDGLAITLFDAGHILGSSSVLVEAGGQRTLFSGDLGRGGTPIIRDPNTRWPEGADIDNVVIESTYGDRDHPSTESIHERLRKILRRALADGGKVLVPAFAIGRTQELLFHLRALIAEGELADIPVIVDGPMGLQVTELYERFPDAYNEEARALLRQGTPPLEFDTLYAARGGKGSEAARSIEGPAIIVAGSGMCTGGRILGHLEEHLPDPRTDVVFAGHQARGTLGRSLLDGTDAVSIRGQRVPVRAQVTAIAGLSAHADRGELLAWLEAVPGKRRVFVTHGEESSANSFSALATERLHVEATVPGEGEPFALD